MQKEYSNIGMKQFIYDYWIWNIDEIREDMVFATRLNRHVDGELFSQGSIWISKDLIKWVI
jgi:hypothetical protein